VAIGVRLIVDPGQGNIGRSVHASILARSH
jgi:hypothetical protein